MMDCHHFREILDCYVDDELSADASADAAAHVRGCGSCARAAAELTGLRLHVREAVSAPALPPSLEARIQHALGPWPARMPRTWRVGAAAAALAGVAVLGWIASAGGAPVRDMTGAAMDRAVVWLSPPHDVLLEGVVLCRDCELEQRYGIPAPCRTTGHHGAIATSDGRIWNIIDHPAARALIHDDSLHGKTVRVHARIVRPAGTIAVESFEVVG
jgi:hypothetical protein